MARQVNIGQGQRGEGPVGILGQASVAYFCKAPQRMPVPKSWPFALKPAHRLHILGGDLVEHPVSAQI